MFHSRSVRAAVLVLAAGGLCLFSPAVRAEIAPGRVVVGFADGAAAGRFVRGRAQEMGLRGPGLAEAGALAPLAATAFEVPAGSERGWAERLRGEPGVRYAEPDALFRAARVPSDSLYPQQWHLHNSAGSGAADLNAELAWNRVLDSGFMILAVLDSGVDFGHPDLGTNIFLRPPGASRALDASLGAVDDTRGWNFADHNDNPSDDNGHGTEVAGVLGALGDNGLGVSGVLWRTQMLTVKVLTAGGVSRGSDIAAGVVYAVNAGARVLNISLSGEDYSTPLFEALQYARDRGAVAVVAAGNDAVNLDASPRYPASFALDNVVAVAATDPYDGLLSSSNRGGRVLLAAPGFGILTTLRGGGYGAVQGTSFAAPQVAGAVAMYWTLRPWENYHQVLTALGAAVKPLTALTGLTASGGRLDLWRLVSQALIDSLAPAAVTDLRATAQQVNKVSLVFTAPGDDGFLGRAESYEARWSLSPLTGASFDTAQAVPAPRQPHFGGTRDTLVVTGLPYRQTVHLALRALDRNHTRGPVSNDVVVTVGLPPVIALSASSLRLQPSAGGTASGTFKIYNRGEARLDGTLGSFGGAPVAWSVLPLRVADFRIAPRDSARVQVDVDASAMTAGPSVFLYPAAIQSNDPAQPQVIFTVAVSVADSSAGAPGRNATAGPGRPRAALSAASDFSVRVMPGAAGSPFRFALGSGWAGASGLRVRVLDVAGREAGRAEPAGSAAGLTWDGRRASGAPAASGIYFLELNAADHRQVVRFLRLR